MLPLGNAVLLSVLPPAVEADANINPFVASGITVEDAPLNGTVVKVDPWCFTCAGRSTRIVSYTTEGCKPVAGSSASERGCFGGWCVVVFAIFAIIDIGGWTGRRMALPPPLDVLMIKAVVGGVVAALPPPLPPCAGVPAAFINAVPLLLVDVAGEGGPAAHAFAVTFTTFTTFNVFFAA